MIGSCLIEQHNSLPTTFVVKELRDSQRRETNVYREFNGAANGALLGIEATESDQVIKIECNSTSEHR